MLKKVFLAAAAAVILAGSTLTMAPTPAQAGHHACHHKGMTKAQKKACKAHKEGPQEASSVPQIARKPLVGMRFRKDPRTLRVLSICAGQMPAYHS